MRTPIHIVKAALTLSDRTQQRIDQAIRDGTYTRAWADDMILSFHQATKSIGAHRDYWAMHPMQHYARGLPDETNPESIGKWHHIHDYFSQRLEPRLPPTDDFLIRLADFEGLPGTPPPQPPIPQLLQRWHDAEAGRYPLKFGGLEWGPNSPYEEEQKVLGFREFAAALDAAAQRAWRLEIYIPARLSHEDPAILAAATVTDTIGKPRTTFAADPLEATVRAIVKALHSQELEAPAGPPPFAAVSFAGEPVDSSAPHANASPAEDMRTWARLEPNRFEKTDTDYPTLKHRGVPCAVLAPAHRGMVVLQYMPALSVFEAVMERGWTLVLEGQPLNGNRYGFQCDITTHGQQAATATYSTAGPTTVKAYLAALRTLS